MNLFDNNTTNNKKVKVTKEGVYLLDKKDIQSFNRLTLSPSTVDSWLQSPADFVLDKYIKPQLIEQEEVHFTRGKWFHSVMESFFHLEKAERTVYNLKKLAIENLKNPDYITLAKDPESQEWIKEILKLYTRDFLKMGQEENVAILPIQGKPTEGLELMVSGKLAPTKRRCFGFIDKVVEGEKGLIVQDWKTGRHVDDYNPNKRISTNNSFGYWRQQTMYSMLLENEGANVEGACLIFPLANTIVNVNQNDPKVREQVIADLLQVDSEMTQAVENGYFFPYKKGKWNHWSSWLGGLGSADRPKIDEAKFMNIAEIDI